MNQDKNKENRHSKQEKFKIKLKDTEARK